MKKGLIKLLISLTIIVLIIASILYYIYLPAINIHSPDLWIFAILVCGIIIVAYNLYIGFKFKKSNKSFIKVSIAILSLLIIIFIAGNILSSPIVNSAKYQQLLDVTERNFSDDIKEISFNEIPLLDKESAQKLGSRKIGSMVDLVSQFEVDNMYTQINYKNKPVRVTPLSYGNMIKWFTNRSQGIPAYIMIDMTNQNVDFIRLNEGIKYSLSEPLNRNVNRYLRFKYPTYMFDNVHFEIDDNGTPYWICPVKKYTIGLFGGVTIGKVVLLNAITGETVDYNINDVPNWVDSVYSAELLISYYNYYGSLKHGYFNSILSQKDCLRTTKGYNYLALEDDVWVYTGVTSVGGDLSNVGFVLMNQRTMETRYYSISGAEEMSAMSSAEGQVQNLGYKATFPLLLNVANEPTYFIALKDNAGLVKKYAMVNVSKYQLVAIGDTVNDCEKTYISLLKNEGINTVDVSKTEKISGIIRKIAPVVIDGNSHYYVMLNDNYDIFDFQISSLPDIVKYSEGSSISFDYSKGNGINYVLSIE